MNQNSFSCMFCKQVFEKEFELDIHLFADHLKHVLKIVKSIEPGCLKQIIKCFQQDEDFFAEEPLAFFLKNQVGNTKATVKGQIGATTRLIQMCEYCLAFYDTVDEVISCLKRHLEESKQAENKDESDESDGEKEDETAKRQAIKRKQNRKSPSENRVAEPTKLNSQEESEPPKADSKQTQSKYVRETSGIHQGKYLCEFAATSTNKWCAKSFLSIFQIERHMKRVHGPYLFHCEKCMKPFRDKRHLRDHLVAHDDTPHQYQCPKCGKMFKFRKYLLAHLKTTITCGSLIHS